ncbi:NYN domain-containing protein [Aureimonas sp. SK2]|uniref:NYN domain-containing protein n=1 Tax=Aureimonas sp. SK2 TaxID=3015992 RepID=UPI002444AA1F|nr:NYN domain-containing protein [Aureimonas sp. SK2]
MRDDRPARLAVLIDADNASAQIADGLFEEIATIGEASVRRIYGDFSSTRSKGWTEVLSKHAIIPHQQFAYVTGKNASDIALVIDAMDLLHSGRFDGFCLVSSDSDFTRLAARIREQGIDVYGFGEQKTPESFRQACRRFVYTENLRPEAAAAVPAVERAVSAKPLLRQVMDQIETDDGWVPLGLFGQRLLNRQSDFDPRTYGHKKLSDLVRASGLFDLEKSNSGTLRLRTRTAATKPPAAAKPASASKPAAGAKPAPAAKGSAAPARGPARKPATPG